MNKYSVLSVLSRSHSPKPKLLQPCRACDVYAKSWHAECSYWKRVYETNKKIKMKSLGTLKTIREAGKRDPFLRENLEASIKPDLDLLSTCFSQLKYSGNPIQTESHADQDDYESFFVDLFSSIFPVEEIVEQSFAYISEDTNTTLQALKDFIAEHCDVKCYSRQIRKFFFFNWD